MQRARIDILDSSCGEASSAPSQPHASPQHPNRCHPWAAGVTQTHLSHNTPQEIEPAIDVSTGEKLLGRPALQLHAPVRFGLLCRAQIRFGGLGRASGIRQRGRQGVLPLLRSQPNRAPASAPDCKTMRRDRTRGRCRPFLPQGLPEPTRDPNLQRRDSARTALRNRRSAAPRATPPDDDGSDARRRPRHAEPAPRECERDTPRSVPTIRCCGSDARCEGEPPATGGRERCRTRRRGSRAPSVCRRWPTLPESGAHRASARAAWHRTPRRTSAHGVTPILPWRHDSPAARARTGCRRLRASCDDSPPLRGWRCE